MTIELVNPAAIAPDEDPSISWPRLKVVGQLARMRRKLDNDGANARYYLFEYIDSHWVYQIVDDYVKNCLWVVGV